MTSTRIVPDRQHITLTLQHRTDVVARCHETINRPESFHDRSLAFTAGSVNADRQTMPARLSVEERWVERVQQGKATIEQATRAIEAHRRSA